MKTDYIKDWEESTNRLMGAFVKKYFTFADVHWIGSEVGGVLSVNDHFFNLSRIVEAIKYNAPKKKMFEYYDLEMEAHEKGKPIGVNFKNYLKKK